MLAAACAAAALLFVGAASQRLGYPHELEWMEGALVDQALRVANGEPLWCAPSPEHVPFLYAPLMTWLGALLIGVGVDGLFALRAVAALATLGCALVIAMWVRREAGSALPGLAAGGLFVAGHGWLHWWFDLARNDSLMVLGVLLAANALRHRGGSRWLAAAVSASLAILTKQTALVWVLAIAIGAAASHSRTALRFAIATTLASGGAFAALHAASDGWSTFWMFEVPSHHPWQVAAVTGFWRRDLLPLVPLLALGAAGVVALWRAGGRRGALFVAAFGAGGLLASWLSRLHAGGFDNVLMYGFAAACVLGPIAAARAASRWQLAAGALLLAQFVVLAGFAIARGDRLLPTSSHRRAHEELAAFVARQRGEVWSLVHGGLRREQGRGSGAHAQALVDLAYVATSGKPRSARADQALAHFDQALAQSLHEPRFAAILYADVAPPFAAVLRRDHLDPYGRDATPLLTAPAAIQPPTGGVVHSPYALRPRR